MKVTVKFESEPGSCTSPIDDRTLSIITEPLPRSSPMLVWDKKCVCLRVLFAVMIPYFPLNFRMLPLCTYIRGSCSTIGGAYGACRCLSVAVVGPEPPPHPVAVSSLSFRTPPPPRCRWFVVLGALMQPPRSGYWSFRALRTERCPRFPAVFACITPRAACATRN